MLTFRWLPTEFDLLGGFPFFSLIVDENHPQQILFIHLEFKTEKRVIRNG